MITTQTVGNTLLAAELKVANMVLANIVSLQGGSLSVNWKPSIKATRGINVIGNKLSIGDISSASFQTAYACLTGFVGTFAGGAIDPNAQNPGVVIDVTGSSGSTVNSTKISFTNQTVVTLSSYNSVYAPTYGNNPDVLIFVSDGAGGFNPDYSTSPSYEYVISGNINSGILSITWGYAIVTSGYVQISGVQQ